MEPPCDLLLMSERPSGESARPWCRPRMVLDGSSGRVSTGACLVRQRGAVSAGLASASSPRTEEGKMETAGGDKK